jgi:toxin ParE1/3/4
LEDIFKRVAADNPAAAPRIIQRIRTAVERLQEFPAIGRPGRIEGTRELIIAGTPYIVPYQVIGDTVQIITVMHSAQQWPDRFP